MVMLFRTDETEAGQIEKVSPSYLPPGPNRASWHSPPFFKRTIPSELPRFQCISAPNGPSDHTVYEYCQPP